MWKVSRCKTAHGRVRSSLFHVCCLYYFPGLAAAKATWRHFSFIDAMVSEICASAWLFLISLTVCVQNVNKRIFIDLQATLKWCLGVHEHCQMWCQHPTTSTNVQDYELWHSVSPSSQSILFVIMKCSWSLSRKSAQASRSEVLLLACREALSGESHVSRVSKGSPYSLRISVLSQQWHGPSVSKCSILKLDNHHSISKFCAVHPVLLHRLNFQQLKQQLSAMDFSLLACSELSKEPWEKLSLRIFRQNLGSRSISTCQFANKYGYPKREAATACELDNHPLLMGMYVYIYIYI